MDRAQIAEAAAWVTSRGFTRVALQFPDDFLGSAVASCTGLEAACPAARVYLLADTTFGSCCVDEVAAAHVDAECVVHFGPSCLSPVSSLPTFLVFPRQQLDIASCADAVVQASVWF